MNKKTLMRRANRERILATATRNIAEHGFHHATRPSIMAGTGLATGTLQQQFATTILLLAAICERHATALLEATGCPDPDSPDTPRAGLVAAAARILACIDAHPCAHTILMRDRPCLPDPARAALDHLDQVAAFQLDRAWSAVRPDLDTAERLATLTAPLRTLLLHWPDWREPGPFGHPHAAADRAVAMVEATIDRPLPPLPPAPPAPALPAPNPHAHWLSDEAAARHTIVGPPAARPAPQDNAPSAPPIRPAPQDTPRPAAQDAGSAPQDAPAATHPGFTLRDTLARHGLGHAAAAARLGLTRQRLHDLTRGARAITPATALRLEAVLGEHAETWMARQARHDLDAARRAAPP
ncbi:MAG: HigA family addiction module antitoxin [Janthinobacterium lividum]